MSNEQSGIAKEQTSAAFIHSKLDEAGLSPTQFRVYCHFVRRANGLWA